MDQLCDACWRDSRAFMPYADADEVAEYCNPAVVSALTDYHGVSLLCRYHLEEWQRYGPLDVVPLVEP